MIVAQGRSPVFYADYGAPDTVEGRFDLVVPLAQLKDINKRMNEERKAGKLRYRDLPYDEVGAHLHHRATP